MQRALAHAGRALALKDLAAACIASAKAQPCLVRPDKAGLVKQDKRLQQAGHTVGWRSPRSARRPR